MERDGDNETEQEMAALEPGSVLSVSQPLGRGYVPKARLQTYRECIMNVNHTIISPWAISHPCHRP